MECSYCHERPPCMIRQYSRLYSCKECFIEDFISQIYQTILKYDMIRDNDRVCVGVSGGKDSSVLIDILYNIKTKYSLNWQLFLLAIDEGIKGYRDDSLAIVEYIKNKYNLPLEILSFKENYGHDMDEIVLKTGSKNNCTICGSYRRNLLNQGGDSIKADKICTGHNADDVAETLLLNLFRGDILKLQQQAVTTRTDPKTKRIKPLFLCSQKEIVLYARYAKIEYFSTECRYLKDAYRGKMRDFINLMQTTNPKMVYNLVNASLKYIDTYKPAKLIMEHEGNKCEKCGALASKRLCKMCHINNKLSD